ncbi:MAG: DEAD/DEAH box helicase [Planctomycetaceae bacterium]
MTSIASAEKQYFDSAVRTRGEEYFRRGFVSDIDVTDDWVRATVANGLGDFYDVSIELDPMDNEVLSAECDCPYFDDHGLCKHLWATILQIDAVIFGRSSSGNSSVRKHKPDQAVPEWMVELNRLKNSTSTHSSLPARPHSDALTTLQQQFWYVLEMAQSQTHKTCVVELMTQQTRANGDPGAIKEFRLGQSSLREVADPVHFHAMKTLLDSTEQLHSPFDYYYSPSSSRSTFLLNSVLAPAVIPLLAATGRLCWRLSNKVSVEDARFVTLDEGPPWDFSVSFVPPSANKSEPSEWLISGQLTRTVPADGPDSPLRSESRPVSDIVMLMSDSLVLFENQLARVSTGNGGAWLQLLQRKATIKVADGDRKLFVQHLLETPQLLNLPLPEDFCPQIQGVSCQPRLRLLATQKLPHRLQHMNFVFGVVHFLYGETEIAASNPNQHVLLEAEASLISRDQATEAVHLKTLTDLGALPTGQTFSTDMPDLKVPPGRASELLHQLIQLGWTVEADGVQLKRPGNFSIGVTSSVDWFELNAEIDFDGISVALPALLQALKSGERFVKLSDGSRGMLPDEWLNRYGTLAGFGEVDGDVIRFKPSQAMILDALLDAQDNVSRDRSFSAFCKKLKDFSGIKTKAAPRTFKGELRDYQKEGLSWLNFLNDFRLGGCLADDMGLGKTIQVLSLLEVRRTRRLKKDEQRRPSLVVVPKSLVFNWIAEAEKFTPGLRVVNYTGTARREIKENLSNYDVIVTTYGTLRMDVVDLKDIRFDHVILDEAQAIKNSDSQAAKACRLLQADHRLAMTGTPVENHLGELWSLFEFLNPGMLGASSAFQRLASASQDPEDREIALTTLARALKPFLLRRTKEQVLTELPGKTEQTLYCEMPPKQKKLYNELRDYYRVQLTSKIEKDGLQKSKIHVLEALLRLRQAACHPGLIDLKRKKESSGKLDAILEQLTQIVDEGHKALVFSQFTSLLSIVRDKLDKEGIRYEYLDGKTSKRQDRVRSFQEDPNCPLFLISLKAGGHGLNLTAADYVFILDPWWNPAVEAQAVDRAHRMGQDRHVFAYRLICRDTVEERILEMQKEKQQLADAIVSADSSLIRSLSAEDLTLLLS